LTPTGGGRARGPPLRNQGDRGPPVAPPHRRGGPCGRPRQRAVDDDERRAGARPAPTKPRVTAGPVREL